MTKDTKNKTWMYAALPAVFVMFLAIYPQLSFWSAKGSNWQGAYFVSNFDEVAYSAYINALINGKPRKYDPYLATEVPHESFYSIQFIPAFSIVLPARLFGLSASTAFIVLNVLGAALSALLIFWMLLNISGNSLLSMTGVLVVCCLGTAVAFEGELRNYFGGPLLVDYLPFLRRYQPAFAFPFVFLFCGVVWRALEADSVQKAVRYSAASGVIFAILIFSYFFLWTAAAAWLVWVLIFTLLWHREKLTNALISLGFIGGFGIVALIPYFFMLSERSPHVDSVQLLANTHKPDLASSSLLLGLVVAALIVVMIWRGAADIRSGRTIFALAFALTPLVLLNQQIVTGRSLQPVHYELFISNYLSLVSLVLLISLLFENSAANHAARLRRALAYMAIVAAGWGIVEASGSTKRNISFADLRDLSIPAIRNIEERERQKPASQVPATVLATNTGTSDFIPTVSLLRPLWSSHSSSGGGLEIAENKRLFYQYLYYSGFREQDIEEGLKANAFEVTAAIFGSERALPALGLGSEPITAQEIDKEVRTYSDYAKNFSRIAASDPQLSYVIVSAEGDPDFTNLDKWYERDAGTVAGLLKVYGVKLRP